MERREFLRRAAVAAAACPAPAVKALAAAAPRAAALRLFVDAAHGHDANDGRAPQPAAAGHGPLATLHGARDLLRKLRSNRQLPPGGAVVALAPGLHLLESPLVLRPEDSGTATGAIVFASQSPATPAVVSGGRTITGWRANARGHWQVTLPEVAAGKWYFSQLFVNGQRRYRPRLPAAGYYTIAQHITPLAGHPGCDGFGFAGQQFNAAWHNLADVEVLCLLEWFVPRMRIAAVNAATHVVRFTGNLGGNFPWAQLAPGKRFIIENVREALARPGQWYLDRVSGLLTYIPVAGETLSTAHVVAPVAPRLVDLAGSPPKALVRHVTFENLDFAHTNWNCPPAGYYSYQSESKLGAAIRARGTSHCTIRQCTVRSVGEHGIAFGAGCTDNHILNCCLHDLGAGGVMIGSTGQPPQQPLARRNQVRNTLVASGGRMHAAGMGVWVGIAQGSRITHNEIRDLYQTGISLGWTWGYGKTAARDNHVAHNYIHLIGQHVTSDMGGIYMLGLSPGTLLHGNVIKNITCDRYGAWGIYFDEGASDIVARHNLTVGTQSAGLMVHYGRNNIVEQNIFAFGQQHLLFRAQFEPHLQCTARHNIFLADHQGVFDFLHDIRPVGTKPGESFRLDDNLYWNLSGTLLFDGLPFQAWQKQSGNDHHSLVANPLFADPRAGKFSLAPGSPASRIKFHPTAWQHAGLTAPTPAQGAVKPQPPAYPVPPGAARVVGGRRGASA